MGIRIVDGTSRIDSLEKQAIKTRCVHFAREVSMTSLERLLKWCGSATCWLLALQLKAIIGTIHPCQTYAAICRNIANLKRTYQRLCIFQPDELCQLKTREPQVRSKCFLFCPKNMPELSAILGKMHKNAIKSEWFQSLKNLYSDCLNIVFHCF